MSKRDLEIKSYAAIPLGHPRDQIKEELCLEATYDREQAKKKREKDR